MARSSSQRSSRNFSGRPSWGQCSSASRCLCFSSWTNQLLEQWSTVQKTGEKKCASSSCFRRLLFTSYSSLCFSISSISSPSPSFSSSCSSFLISFPPFSSFPFFSSSFPSCWFFLSSLLLLFLRIVLIEINSEISLIFSCIF